MSDERATGEKWSLPAAERTRIDRLADEFEREFNEGRQPRIEAYLEQAPELRSYLLDELIRVEVELRQTAGQQPMREEYVQRFPDAQAMVNAVFSVVESSGARIESTRDRPASPDDTDTEDEPTPERLGRYRIQRRLGRGGFGVVYLAHDPDLDRPVALKVPRRKRLKTRDQVGDFMKEARTAAKLKHPGLVTVHDVQQEDGWPYIVQEFIEGQDLAEWAREQKPSHEQIARLFIGIAEAVGYAHQQELTHCDLKLANVLMDTVGDPHVADFGLAMHESVQTLHKGKVFGTPAMMAPEQVRGETHRFDDRTDIWAMGVMLYEVLTGRRPFSAQEQRDLFEDIQKKDPRPPRQIDRSVPREVERICLRCLSKRQSERYGTTDDLREDLQAWLDEQPETASSIPSAQSTTEAAAPDSSSGSSIPAKVIPKGLRSFDAEDADFFLDLLPGPRDRNGLPESIRFWKRRIEEDDPDKTFSVGLIYGPSGCGKSSLLKAGLLPRLSDSVVPVFVEATAADTEVRLLKQLHKNLPQLPTDIDLPAACAELRMTGAGRGRKVLLVLDQFEQWLHAHAELKGAQLVDALRQCEGSRLQAVVLVRDDFYLSVNRLFQELDIRLVEGHNYSVIDLFDLDHARRVLKAFGRAYGKLDEELSPEQEEFLTRAVAQLAEDNKIISVRLALFADMMKSHAWVPTSLEDVGGVGGVGVTFLEETFAAKTAPPSHRIHQRAVRGVLKTLLPEAGTDIKGAMRSTDQLRDAAEYSDQPRQFTELLHILDSEVRLITPTDPEGVDEGPDVASDGTYYQLTHDYLVPSLRDWLTRKQKETRRGRAELRLADRSAAWNAKQENRHLPASWEYLNIRVLTDRSKWTEPQQKMMRRARFVHGARWALALVLLLIAGVISQFGYREIQKGQVAEKVDVLRKSEGLRARLLIEDLLNKFPERMVKAELQQQFAKAQGLQRVPLAFALAKYGDVRLEFLLEQVREASNEDLGNFVAALKHSKEQAELAMDSLARTCTEKQDWTHKTRLAVLGLHLADTTMAAEMLRGEPDKNQTAQAIPNPLESLRQQLVAVNEMPADQQNTPRNRLMRATAHYYLDRPEDALQDLNELATNADVSPRAFWLQALCLAREGKADESTEAADRLAESEDLGWKVV
ncbi:MAG: serine/threonine protein kinase, partial [Planctomycetota bacterium]